MKNFNTLLTLSELKEHYGNPPVGICPLYYGKLDKTIVESKTGNPIVIPPYKTITSLNISFSPQQAGSGDPSPENVRPITGRDEVAVNVRGKNLLSDENFQSSVQSGITFTKMGNGVVHIEGTSTSYADSVVVNDVPQLPPGTYYGISPYLTIVVKKASTGSNMYYSGTGGVTIKAGDVIRYYYFSIETNKTINTTEYIFLAPGESAFSASDFEPYKPGTTAQLPLPETIYGGTVDAVTGVGSKTWGFIASYNGEALPEEWISDRDVYASGTTPTTGAQVAYKLATPEPLKVNPISIPSLSGINTIYSDADNLSCDFKISSFWGDAD